MTRLQRPTNCCGTIAEPDGVVAGSHGDLRFAPRDPVSMTSPPARKIHVDSASNVLKMETSASSFANLSISNCGAGISWIRLEAGPTANAYYPIYIKVALAIRGYSLTAVSASKITGLRGPK